MRQARAEQEALDPVTSKTDKGKEKLPTLNPGYTDQGSSGSSSAPSLASRIADYRNAQFLAPSEAEGTSAGLEYAVPFTQGSHQDSRQGPIFAQPSVFEAGASSFTKTPAAFDMIRASLGDRYDAPSEAPQSWSDSYMPAIPDYGDPDQGSSSSGWDTRSAVQAGRVAALDSLLTQWDEEEVRPRQEGEWDTRPSLPDPGAFDTNSEEKQALSRSLKGRAINYLDKVLTTLSPGCGIDQLERDIKYFFTLTLNNIKETPEYIQYCRNEGREAGELLANQISNDITLRAFFGGSGDVLGATCGSIFVAASVLQARPAGKTPGKRAKIKAARKKEDLIYKGAPYHHVNSKGTKSPEPSMPQELLKNHSVAYKEGRRLAVDKKNNQFAVFDYTNDGTWHGHIRTWGGLHPNMQKLLIKLNLVNKRGKPK